MLIIGAAVLLFFIIRRPKKSIGNTTNGNADDIAVKGPPVSTLDAIGNTPKLRTGSRTMVVAKDTTLRRCVRPDGTSFYVKGPCPQYK